ncbi:MAG: 50S ribosomal protein L10 [Fibrobacterales bacterium]
MAAIEEKKVIVDSIVEKINGSMALYFLDFVGISVEQDTILRKSLTNKGIEYVAVKNTLLKRALAECNIEGFDDKLVGTTSVMFGSEEEPMLPAKEIVEFYKANPDRLAVKGVSMDGEDLSATDIKEIAKMPGRQELIAQIVSIALGPGANLVGIIKGPGSTIAGQLKALEEKLN